MLYNAIIWIYEINNSKAQFNITFFTPNSLLPSSYSFSTQSASLPNLAWVTICKDHWIDRSHWIVSPTIGHWSEAARTTKTNGFSNKSEDAGWGPLFILFLSRSLSGFIDERGKILFYTRTIFKLMLSLWRSHMRLDIYSYYSNYSNLIIWKYFICLICR